MPRLPIDTIPQKRLVYELKLWVDRARHSDESSPQYEMAVGYLNTLVLENPDAARRAHVLHNLGCGRRRWLRQLSTKLEKGELTDLLWQMGCGNK